MGDSYLILGVFFLVLIDAVILTAWFILDPFETKERQVGSPVVSHLVSVVTL